MRLNNFDNLANDYEASNEKPDKLYSILPTLLHMAGDLQGKTVLDLGCGSGFFTRAFADRGAEYVIGIDNSFTQLNLANQQPRKNVEYILGDMFNDPLPSVDIILAPFVLNYAPTVSAFEQLIVRLYHVLRPNGFLLGVVDLPSGSNLDRFGARKNLLGPRADGTRIQIELYNGAYICTLYSYYFSPYTIEAIFRKAGFSCIEWYQPIISPEGIHRYGELFWEGYQDNPELGYLKVYK